MRRRLEKNIIGFSHVFSADLSYILSNILCRTNKWFTTAENTDVKYIGNFL